MMTEMSPTQNGWNEWSKYILKELERLGNVTEATRNDIQTLRTEVASARVKTQSEITGLRVAATIWGSAGGIVLGVVASIIVHIVVT